MIQAIKSKYVEKLLIPANGIPAGIAEVKTTDGVLCAVKFLGTWNNADGRYDEEFEYLCQKQYGCSFRAIRSIWIARLGHVDNYWHFIELTKL